MLPSSRADYTTGKINSQRDLEDFARLWICGMPALTNAGYQVTLSWGTVSSGNPVIKLFQSVETNGGTLYLTDTNVAAAQTVLETYVPYYVPGPGLSIGTVTNGTTFTFPASYFTNSGNKYLLFEGAGIGAGQLTLTISQNSNTIAQTGVWLDLHDVKDFYERAVITNTVGGAISNMTSGVQTVQYATESALGDGQDIIVYVHGASNKPGSWLVRSDTIAKRLYWTGFHGKFASVHWPSEPDYSLDFFNIGEVRAYKAASAFKDYLAQLRTRFPGCRLHILAHSHGGAMTSEAFSEGASFDTLILSQVAMSASCYDVAAPTDASLVAKETGSNITPDWQPMGYHGAHTNITGRIVNYFNVDDGLLKLWVTDQKDFKPSPNYSYNGTNCWYLDPPRLVLDPQESRGHIARSRTLAVGAEGTTAGVVQSAINLKTQFGIGTSTDEHSAFFMRPIQSIWPYYKQILVNIQPTP
jgi:pimeloyl-ACP methyl ester carboxylesterase